MLYKSFNFQNLSDIDQKYKRGQNAKKTKINERSINIAFKFLIKCFDIYAHISQRELICNKSKHFGTVN